MYVCMYIYGPKSGVSWIINFGTVDSPECKYINKLINNDLEVAHPQSGSSSTWFLVELEFENVGFWGERKTGVPGYRRKTYHSKRGNQQQTQPTYAIDARIWTWATLVGGKHSHHCVVPCSSRAVNPRCLHILRIDRTGMIDVVIMHGTWCLLYKTRDLGTRLIITNLGWHSMRKNNVVGFVTFHLIDLLPNDPIIKLFWKNSSHVSGLRICIFVALWLWMCVAGAN